MPLNYYDPENKKEYKKLKKNFQSEMKKPKPTFENNLREYQEEKQYSPYPQEETVTYEIKRKTPQAQFTKKGQRKRTVRNISVYLTIVAAFLILVIQIYK